MNSPFTDSKKRTALVQYTGAWVMVLLGLFVVSRYNFLLFHGIAELFSIAVAWSVFFLVWNTKMILHAFKTVSAKYLISKTSFEFFFNQVNQPLLIHMG